MKCVQIFSVIFLAIFCLSGDVMASEFKLNYAQGYRFFEIALQKMEEANFADARNDLMRSHELLTKVKMERPSFRYKKIKWIFSEIQKGLKQIDEVQRQENEKEFIETFRDHYFTLKEQNERLLRGQDDLLKAYEALIADQEVEKKKLDQEIVHLQKTKEELQSKMNCLESLHILDNKKQALLLDQLRIAEAKLCNLSRQNDDLKERLAQNQEFVWSLREDGLLDLSRPKFKLPHSSKKSNE